MITTETIRAAFKDGCISAGTRIKTAKRQTHAEEPGLHCTNHLKAGDKTSTGAAWHKNTQSRCKIKLSGFVRRGKTRTDAEQECVRGLKEEGDTGINTSIERRQENQKADYEFVDIVDYDYDRKVPPFPPQPQVSPSFAAAAYCRSKCALFQQEKVPQRPLYCVMLWIYKDSSTFVSCTCNFSYSTNLKYSAASS